MAALSLARCTSREVASATTVVIPVGSLEQHGPHLPLDTDTAIACAVAEGLAAALAGEVWVAPPVAYGSSGEHQHFAGTSSIGGPVLRQLVVELVRSVGSWCSRVVLVNGHGGNLEALHAAVAQLRAEGHQVLLLPCAPHGDQGDLHAARSETSLMLHLRPESVRVERAEAGSVAPLTELLPAMRHGGVRAVSSNGVLGDPTGASAAEGAKLLGAMVEESAAATRLAW